MYTHDGITLVLKLSNILSSTAAIWLALAMERQMETPGVPFRWSEADQVSDTGWTRGKCRRAAQRAASHSPLLSIPAPSTYLVDVDAIHQLAGIAPESRAESINEAPDARAESISEQPEERAESITEAVPAARNRSNTNAPNGTQTGPNVSPTEIVLGTAGRPAGAPMREGTAPVNCPDVGALPALLLERLRGFGLRDAVIAWTARHRSADWVELRLARMDDLAAAGRAKDPPALLTYLLKSEEGVRPPVRRAARRGWTLDETAEIFRQRQIQRDVASASALEQGVHPALAGWLP